METRPNGAPKMRTPTLADLNASIQDGAKDFIANPLSDFFFASFFVGAGLVMTWITYATGTTFWLILAVLGFPLIGSLASLGFYETSRRQNLGEARGLREIMRVVWVHRGSQLPWLAAIVVVIFLFWFFLGHMIFALFLGLSPMTNVSTSLQVFFTGDGLLMMFVGTGVGGLFAVLVFSVCVLGMPMILDREVDFITAMIRSIAAVLDAPGTYLSWGLFIGVVTLISMLPLFLGLFIAMPILGHASWHLYKRVALAEP